MFKRLFRRTGTPKGLFSYPDVGRRGVDLRSLPLAVIDVETTGLAASRDRVVEIAIVRVESGRVIDEWSTLLDPGCDVGPTFIHHVTNEMVAGAPTFRDVVGDILPRLDGAVVVAHNASFDEGFVRAEFARLGIVTPPIPAACTLTLARSLIHAPNYRLATCCAAIGIEHRNAHAALGDARVTARLAGLLLDRAPLVWPAAPSPLPRFQALAKPRTRATNLRKGSEGWMANLMAALPVTTTDAEPEEADAYLEALAEALADGKLTGDETRQLGRLAGAAGLGAEQLRDLHRRLLDGMRSAADEDGVLTPTEVRQLVRVAELLGAPGYFDGLTATGTDPVPLRKGRGPRVWCAPGVDIGIVETMREGGLAVASNLTVTVSHVVCLDPDGTTPKLEKARAAGAVLVAASRFSDGCDPFEVLGLVRPTETGNEPAAKPNPTTPGGTPHAMPVANTPKPLPVGPIPPPPGVAAAWLTDPTGRGEHRYFDGIRWTHHTSSKGTVLFNTPWLPSAVGDGPGMVAGRPIHEQVATINALAEEDSGVDALVLAYRCIDASENDDARTGTGVAPACYEVAARLHRGRGERELERLVLERFAAHRHAPGATPGRLLERLAVVRGT